jgi:hypothetical protein
MHDVNDSKMFVNPSSQEYLGEIEFKVLDLKR